MRCIIIEDKDARALLEKLELTKFQERMRRMKPDVANDVLRLSHRLFHYEVCRWLQDQGCNIVR